MNYNEYLQLRDLYVNHKEQYEELVNKKLAEVFIAGNRFFDVFGTEQLYEDEYYELMENYDDVVDTYLLKEIAEIHDYVDEDVPFMKFQIACLEYQALVLKDTLTYKTIEMYIKAISRILHYYYEIPDDYALEPDKKEYYSSSLDEEIDVKVPNLFRYNYYPYEALLREDKIKELEQSQNEIDLHTTLLQIYKFASGSIAYDSGDGIRNIETNLRNVAWVYKTCFEEVIPHILAALSALNELSIHYDKYLIDKACIDFETFGYLFADINDQNEVLGISTSEQLELLEKTAKDLCKNIIQNYINKKENL